MLRPLRACLSVQCEARYKETLLFQRLFHVWAAERGVAVAKMFVFWVCVKRTHVLFIAKTLFASKIYCLQIHVMSDWWGLTAFHFLLIDVHPATAAAAAATDPVSTIPLVGVPEQHQSKQQEQEQE